MARLARARQRPRGPRPGCALFAGLGHLKTSEVGDVLERAVRRIEKHLDRCGLPGTKEDHLDLSGEGDPESNLASSVVSGQSPPAGPQWASGLRPLRLQALAYEKPQCASLDGFTLHAATRAGGLDAEGREALLRYVLRPPIAQERVEQRPDGLVRITLKKAYTGGYRPWAELLKRTFGLDVPQGQAARSSFAPLARGG